jgi:hypothetical protein
MTTNTTNLGIQKPADGSQTGTWGQTVNTNMDLIDQAISGVLVKTLTDTGSQGSPNALPIDNNSVSEGRNAFIEFTDAGDLGGTAYVQLTPSLAEKIVNVKNNLSGSRDIVFFQGNYGGGVFYTLRNGANALIKFSGTGNSSSVTDVNSALDVTALTVSGDRVLTEADTGENNGLDADTVDGLQASAFQLATDSLTTSTPFGGDVSGTYDNLQVTNNSHNHDDRYFTESQIDDFFDGSTPKTGYNNANWNAAYNDTITSATFVNGDLTLTQQDAGTIVTNLDGRYSQTDTNTTDFLLATNLDSGFQIDAGDEIRFNTSGSAVVTQTNGTVTIYADQNVNTTDLQAKVASEGTAVTLNANDVLEFEEGGATSISRTGSTFVISSTDTNTDNNNYVTSATFDDTNGNLTLGRGGTSSLSDVTVNLDDRYLISAPNAVDYIDSASFNTSTGLLTLTGQGNAGATVDLDGRYLTSAAADTNDYVNSASFSSATGNVTLGRTGSSSLSDIVFSMDGRYLPIASYSDTNNYADTLAFSSGTGVLTIGRTGLSDLTVNLDGRYAAADTNNYVTSATFDDTNGNLTLGRGGTSSLSDVVVNLDDRYLTSAPNAIDYINNASFNTSTGLLTLSGAGNAGATVNLDNRYLLTSNYVDTDTTSFNIKANAGTSTNISADETITFQEAGATTISRSGNTITISSTDTNTDTNSVDYVSGASFNSGNGIITLTGVGNAGATVDIDGRFAVNTLSLTAGNGLTGGGNLTADRSFNVGAGTGISVAADTVGLATDQRLGSGLSVYAGGSDTYVRYQDGSTAYHRLYVNGDEGARLTGTGSNEASWDVAGNITAYTAAFTSDARFKDDVLTLENPLDTVQALRGVSFTWNEKTKREGKKDIGLIAQEVQSVLPELVVEAQTMGEEDQTHLTVDYSKMVAVLIEAVKELSAEVKALKESK